MSDPFVWSGRFDGDDVCHRRLFQVINQSTAPQFGLLGFESDEGVRRNQGRLGAAAAPDLIRKQMASFPVHQSFSLTDFGNVSVEHQDLEAAQAQLGEKVTMLMNQGITPIVLGGGHETAYGSFQGIFHHVAQQHPNESIGIINFDAHFDLRAADENTSGTPFLNAAHLCQAHDQPFHYLVIGIAAHANTRALFDKADQLNATYVMDTALADLNHTLKILTTFVNTVDHIYITIDLDVFSNFIAPGVSAPAVRGISVATFEALFIHLIDSGKVRLLDIVECNPNFDIDQRTTKLAAFIAYQFIQYHIQKEPS
ncbi:formimidoylglutamase [Wohlfahrtiimonas chitiniclastica]|uniref:formimidoylglutamase n=1 Tax=Wohlfahrtiimonas chitiniclastica TaxID=400946 RepID=UPI0007B40052|nr:formimidoylglutamase [Wohlfahrtiimonas chitiniclastica]KZS22918.1 formimidoylglutamase [Wohlfahrtiimonas chitiniclastica]MDC7252851.1 formimidoylglutamase [Wohlfahrtiimonas chitiniclastica]OYQ90603.1 formimidoylglutamase [Wohlfahrtiimonas chitiniclastica]WHR55361.1 formimidoylglutamase [Wohlfahrtiimonas chitiniclastica]